MKVKQPNEILIEDLKEQLARDLESKELRMVKFKPVCNTEYTTNIHQQMLVGDCDKITDQEKIDFCDAISSKANRSARAICSLNDDCPKHRLLRYRWEHLSCKNRLLVADIKFWFVCIKKEG